MIVHIKLVGFGGDRPAAFANADEMTASLVAGDTLAMVLARIGLDAEQGLAILLDEKPVAEKSRGNFALHGGESIVVLQAIEGGKSRSTPDFASQPCSNLLPNTL